MIFLQDCGCAALFCMRVTVFVLFLLTSASMVSAETIIFNDGSFISGDIVLETDDQVRVSEKAGDAFVENDYNLTDIKKIGERDIDEERKDPSLRENKVVPEVRPVLQVMDDDPEYDRMVEQIAETLPSLHKAWEVDHFDFSGIRNWFVLFNELRSSFKEKYSASKRISCTYANLLFVYIDNFKIALDNMEDASRMRQEHIRKNASPKAIEMLTNLMQRYEASADEALDEAVQYARMTQERLAK